METQPTTTSPTPKPARRPQIAVACNRCRNRKTKCDGARPQCGPCAGSGQECYYVADADAPATIAQKRRNEVLEQLCTEQLSFLEALVSVLEVDAVTLLGRFRDGEEIPSSLAVATHMPRIHKEHGLFASSRHQQPSSWGPAATAFEHHRNGSPFYPRASASPSLPVFEPKIDMTPTPQDPFRYR